MTMMLRLCVLLAGVLVAMLLFLYALRLVLPPNLRPSVGPISLESLPGMEPDYLVLVVGVDSNGAKGSQNTYVGSRTDTMLLVRPNPHYHTLNVVSLPRDSKVYLDAAQTKVGKLNSAHALGGIEKTKAVIEQAFGLPIQRYIAVDTKAIKALVEALGGVDLFVERRMHYTDNTAKLFINLEKGYQHLNGKQAEGFLRFRHDAYGDIGRIRRQQVFLDAMKKKMADPTLVFQLPQLIAAVQPYIQTNMGFNELLSLGGYVRGIQSQQLRFATLPGQISDSESTSYWIVQDKEASVLLNRLLFNQMPEPPLEGSKATTLGVFYAPELGLDTATMEASFTRLGFVPTCFREKRLAMTQIVDHTLALSDQHIEALQNSLPALQKARVAFVAKTSSLTPQTCANEDVTLVLGEDALPTSTPATTAGAPVPPAR
jgi:LCP family protein required for cell wall assembly